MTDYETLAKFGVSVPGLTGPVNNFGQGTVPSAAAPANPVAMAGWGINPAGLAGQAPMARPVLPSTAASQIPLGPEPVAGATPGFTPPDLNWMNGSASDWASGGAAAPGGVLDTLAGWLKGAIGTKEAPGWGGLAIGGASALSNAFLGMKQYGIAKQTLEEGKRQFNMNWDAKRNMLNADLADRQAARLAANPNSGMSVADYMSKYGVK